MMKVAQIAVGSQISTKHINTVWAEREIVECYTCRCITKVVGFKRLRWMYW
jgi:exoribonuclease R